MFLDFWFNALGKGREMDVNDISKICKGELVKRRKRLMERREWRKWTAEKEEEIDEVTLCAW